MAGSPTPSFSTPLRGADKNRDSPVQETEDNPGHNVEEDNGGEATHSEAIVIRRVGSWAVEHEPESDSYLLIDAAGGFCADLHWNDRGECWAQFEPYVAFSGATTIADIELVAKLGELLRSLSPPAGRAPKNNPRR